MAGRAVIGGLVIDAMLVGAIAAFGWAGIQLGGRTSLRRTIASWIAIAVAAALRDPIGDAVASMFGWSDEFARLAGIVVVGIGTYAAASNVLSWVLRRRTPDFEDEEEVFERADRIDGRRVAAVAGTLLGVPWALILVGTIVLLPTDSVVTRSAVASWSGGGLIREGHVLRWMERGFPRYTQTLPKGRRGVVVGERARLPMRGAETPRSRPQDADALLAVLNDLRRVRRVRTLAFNADVAAVARRQALAMASDRALSYDTTAGVRVRAALGESAGSFSEDVGVEVVWSHSPSNAGVGIVDDRRASKLVRDPRWTEVGIGVADAGWFDGRVYVLLLVGPEGATTSADDPGDFGAAAAAGELPEDRCLDGQAPPAADPDTAEPCT